MVKHSNWFVLAVAVLGLVASACDEGGGSTAGIHVQSVNNAETGDATLWLEGPEDATTDYQIIVDNGGRDGDAPYTDVHVEIYVDQGDQTELEDRFELGCWSPGLLPVGGVCQMEGEVYVGGIDATFVQGSASLRFVVVQGVSDVLAEESVPVVLEAY